MHLWLRGVEALSDFSHRCVEVAPRARCLAEHQAGSSAADEPGTLATRFGEQRLNAFERCAELAGIEQRVDPFCLEHGAPRLFEALFEPGGGFNGFAEPQEHLATEKIPIGL